MFEVRKTPLAEADLKEIWRYTYRTWGEAQADRYLRQLAEAFHLLADNPGMGTPRDTIRSGYRSHQVNRHVAWYRIGDAYIEIIRVLHDRMEPLSRFEE